MRGDFLTRLRRRLSPTSGERGSAMVMALMLMLIFAVAGVTLATVLGVNARLALQTSTRGISVYVAEAGLETTLGMFRSATSTTAGIGDLKSLPCQVTGSSNGSTDPDQQYIVTVRYGKNDPSTHATDAAWLAATNTAAVTSTPNGFSPVSCVTSATGTAGPVEQPYYALVSSSAAHGDVGGRALLAVYSFTIDSSHITTGQLGVRSRSTTTRGVPSSAFAPTAPPLARSSITRRTATAPMRRTLHSSLDVRRGLQDPARLDDPAGRRHDP